MIDLTGKVTLITGSARGIGKSIAERTAEAGSDIVVCDINEDEAKATAEEIAAKGVRSKGYRCDVSNGDDVKALIQTVLDDFGKIDVLVNNAGITRDGMLMRMKEEDWDLVLNINLKGAFLTTREVVRPMMKQKGGRIINITSIVGMMGNAGQANYTASKGGLISLTKTTAREYASRNVTANAVAPGFIDTALTRELPEKNKEQMLAQVPLGRMGTTEDVANAVVFLASDMASYITGQVLPVNGGMLMS